MSAPTNLKVLPKNTTAEQVRTIMRQWEGDTGMGCGECHAQDPTRTGQNGRPMMNFADDSKPEEQVSRIMYKMTEDMNATYYKQSMALEKGAKDNPVTCGMCHRGKAHPDVFVAPPRQGPGPGDPGGPGGPTAQAPGQAK